jgi:hypothetical protein
MFTKARRRAAIAGRRGGETWYRCMHLDPTQLVIGQRFENTALEHVWIVHQFVNIVHRGRRHLGVCKGFEGLLARLRGDPSAHYGIDLVAMPDACRIVLKARVVQHVVAPDQPKEALGHGLHRP